MNFPHCVLSSTASQLLLSLVVCSQDEVYQSAFASASLTLGVFFQVNGISVLEMSHSEVVSLIQGLPIDFRLVVARKRDLVDHDELLVGTEVETELESEFERQGDNYVKMV